MAGLIKWYLATKAWPSRVQYVLSYQRPRDMAIELGITRLNRPVPKHFKTIQASLLCILGRLEGGKKKARVGRWEEEREEPRPRGSRIFRLFYDRPPYDCYFSSFATFGTGVPSGSLFGGERIRAVIKDDVISKKISVKIFRPVVLVFFSHRKQEWGIKLKPERATFKYTCMYR